MFAGRKKNNNIKKNNGFIFLEVGSPTDIFGYLYS